MLHRWNLLNRYHMIKNCQQKIESCVSIKWCDYGYDGKTHHNIKSNLIESPASIKISYDNTQYHNDYKIPKDINELIIIASIYS
jgi:hypothetical protein